MEVARDAFVSNGICSPTPWARFSHNFQNSFKIRKRFRTAPFRRMAVEHIGHRLGGSVIEQCGVGRAVLVPDRKRVNGAFRPIFGLPVVEGSVDQDDLLPRDKQDETPATIRMRKHRRGWGYPHPRRFRPFCRGASGSGDGSGMVGFFSLQ